MFAEGVRPADINSDRRSVVRFVKRFKSRGLVSMLIVLLLLSSALTGLIAVAFDVTGPAPSEHVRILAGIAPVFVSEPKDPINATYGVQLNITAIVKDGDNGTLRVTWVWGDGKVNVTTVTGAVNTNIVIRNNHVYTPPIQQGRGDYRENQTLVIYLDDNNGNNVSCTTLVRVLMPPNGYPTRPGLYLNGTGSSKIDPAAVVYVVANASDPEGESLTWTYVFNNGTADYRVEVLNTPATAPNQMVYVNISHSFGTIGLHRIDIFVSDALIPYQIFPHNMTNTIFATVTVNTAPSVLATINVDPNNPVVNTTIGYRLVNFSLDASDLDGDVLTFTWDFGDGTAPVVNTSAGGTGTFTARQSRNYTDEGIFNVTVNVTDGRPGHEVLRYRIVTVNSTNLPPNLLVFRPLTLSGGNWELPNATIDFELIIQDTEHDSIEVTINWGDGSEIVHLILSDYSGNNVTCMLNHSYSSRGNFTITVNFTDNKLGILNHNKTYNQTIETRVVIIGIAVGWSWWDYTTLGIAFLIPVLILVWFVLVSRRRKRLEKEGMSLEEWKLMKDMQVQEALEKETGK